MNTPAPAARTRVRRIVMCVDDVALNPAVTTAVVKLARLGVISAASAMVESPHWVREAARLRELSIDVGLHFNMTHSFGPLAQPTLSWPALVLRAWSYRLSGPLLHDAFDRQLEAFTRNARRLPDFIDSHQHVHQFPQIRAELFRAIDRWWPGAMRPWVRSTYPVAGRHVSLLSRLQMPALQARLGGPRFRQLAEVAELPTNRTYAGLYNFDLEDRLFAKQCDRWLSSVRDGSLWTVHPAAAEWNPDPIAKARVAEYAVLRSSSFRQRMADAGIRVCRGSDIYVKALRAKRASAVSTGG